MKVCIFRASDGACDYYRTLIPMHTALAKKEIQLRELWISNLLVSMTTEKKKFVDAMSSDIYFLQRVNSSLLIEKLRSFIKEANLNSKLVMDYDDDIFHVSPLSNHYVDYGTEEIKILNNGQIVHEWKDGENINIEQNIKRIEEIKKSISMVDMITTTNDHLARILGEYNPNVKVLPNCVDFSSWNNLDIRRKDPNEIRICWQGGHSHWEDLHLIRNSLIEIARRYENVKILMVGYMPHSMEKDFKPGQFEFHPWVETSAHPYHMASLDADIAIIPVKDSIFNRSKSIIKWVEFSALEVPCITSYVPPYDIIQEADDINKGIFVENNDEGCWVRGLELLIKDANLRKEIGKNAREYVIKNHDINTQYHQWINAFEEVKRGNTIKSCSR